MTRRGLLLLALAALTARPAWGGAGEISALEQQRALLERHRSRLEALLDDHGRRVARLKAQPAGVGRDYQLQAALRESQAIASKLTQLRAQLRTATERLMAAYEAAARGAASEGERARYQRLRAELIGKRQDTRIVTREQAGRLDSPEDLDEKADLLQDSEEKVRRQIRQVEAKIAQLENRARVQRHGRALDDNPFVEESPRRTGQARRTNAPPNAAGTTGAGDSKESGGRNTPPTAGQATPGTPPPPSPGAFNGDASGGPSGGAGTTAGAKAPAAPDGSRTGSEVIISIREVMDPAILKDPKLNARGEDLAAHLAALRNASQRLRQVAGQLSNQARELRQRAKMLRTQK